MHKTKLSFIVDVLLFTFASAITGIGLLVECVLVSGSIRDAMYGRGTKLLFWGMDGHDACGAS